MSGAGTARHVVAFPTKSSRCSLPRLYFDIDDDGDLRRDSEGVVLPDERAARDEAIQTLVGLARDILPSDGRHRTIAIVVRGDGDRKLFTASLRYDEGA